jgi:hypothetical protein
MIILSPGDIFYIYVTYIHDPHYKYIICICPDHPLFFFINTEPRRTKLDAQLLIKKDDYPFLAYDSYINTGEMVTFGARALQWAKWVGRLTAKTKAEILEITKNSRYLPPLHCKKISENFSI